MPDTSPEKDVDLSTLYEIADGSNEFIVESITMFLDQTPQLLQSIEDAITASDWVATASASHKIKSNLGFFGMFNCQALTQELEVLSKAESPNPEAITSKFTQLKNMMTDNLAELARVKTQKEANI